MGGGLPAYKCLVVDAILLLEYTPRADAISAVTTDRINARILGKKEKEKEKKKEERRKSRNPSNHY